MKKTISTLLLAGFVLAAPLSAAPLATGSVERLNYSWRLKGALSWIARLAFPSSGRGTLETRDDGVVNSRLMINAADEKGYYLYESQMAPQGTQTLVSRSAYSFRDNARDERVSFEPENGVARIEKTSKNGTETKTRKLEAGTPQDVLTAIYYLRQHADEIRSPQRAKIFSGARGYDVTFRPLPLKTIRVGGKDVRVRPFAITPVDDRNRFGGEVRVALSNDERRIPLQIDIQERFARLSLDLQP